MATSKPEKDAKPGPKAETLVIEGEWGEAVKKAVQKAPPIGPSAPKREPPAR